MGNDFATALGRALGETRASDPMAATATIQAALFGQPFPGFAESGDCAPCAAFSGTGKGADRPTAGLDLSSVGGTFGRFAPSGMTGLSGMADPAGRTGGVRTPRRAPVPNGARVETRRHEAAAGSRDYRLFVPSPRDGGLVGVVVMLHGCTQSPEDFALGTRMDIAAEAVGFVVAYPGQTGAHNMQSCWNWFRPQDQGRDGGEPAILADLAMTLADEFDLKGRVHVAGLSAGGAMAAALAETHPEVFAAAGIHSGLPAGSARDVSSAFAAMRGQGAAGRAPAIPAIVFHGTADGTVSPRNARVLVPGDGIETRHEARGRRWTRLTTDTGSELWLVDGAGHGWFGGDAAGSYADPSGPDASAEMLRFFAERTRE